jgi:hypothetical protein
MDHAHPELEEHSKGIAALWLCVIALNVGALLDWRRIDRRMRALEKRQHVLVVQGAFAHTHEPSPDDLDKSPEPDELRAYARGDSTDR